MWVTIARHLLFPLILALKVFRGKRCAFSSHTESKLPPSLAPGPWSGPGRLYLRSELGMFDSTWTVNVRHAGFLADTVNCCAVELSIWFSRPLVCDGLLAFFDFDPRSIQCYFRVSSLCYLTGYGCVDTIPIYHRF